MKTNKKIKKLKTKHIWPSFTIFTMTMIMTVFFILSVIYSFVSYVIESKYSPDYYNLANVARAIEQANTKDINDVKSEIDYINRFNNKYQDIFIVDSSLDVVSGIGEFTPDPQADVTMFLFSEIDGYLDKSDVEKWTNEEGQFNYPVKEVVMKSLTNAESYDKNIEVFDMSLWTVIPLENSSNKLMAKTRIALNSRDVVFILFIATFAAFITMIPLIFLLSNVISSVRTLRQMSKLLYLDEVTGGNNWSYFKDNAKKILCKLKNRGKSYGIYDLELMKYRSFCACCGVEEGEQMLEDIYKRINRGLRRDELCVRYSKANFALMLNVANDVDAEVRMEAIQDRLHDVAGNHRTIIHAGCYIIPAATDAKTRKKIDIATVYNSASAARSSVSAIEENAFALFTDKLLEDQMWEHKVEESMDSALENKEFHVYYQPKYNPITEELAGAEALIRWITPDGIISPGRFIPIFEKNGFITKIDDYMIANVAKQQAQWLAEGRKIVPVSVNVSRAHFTKDDLAEHILQLVDQYDIPHEYIEIELTESAFFDDKNVLLNVVNKLKNYGFEISMDDFGAGYSSLNSLKDLPLDVLKLDAGFFRGDENDSRAEIVVSEAISLAKQLNMRIVAEGIEKKNQVDFLAKHNCDMIQGYYYAKPMPANEYEERM